MVKNEPRYAGEFLASLANGQQSLDNITILSGFLANPGDVLGMILDGAAVPAAAGGNTGNGVLGAVTISQGAKPGVYNLTAISPTKFILEDPAGIEAGVVTVATPFAAAGLAFTLAAGGAAFVVGDAFTITVAVGSQKYVPIDQAGVDGRQIAAGISYNKTDATLGDAAGLAVVRQCEVNGAEIGWGALDAGHILTGIAALKARGIIVRTGSV
jgi:hypothetical protein